MSRYFRLVWLVAVALLAANLDAKGRQGHGSDSSGPGAVFQPSAREIILDYFRIRPSNLPPGLAKRNGNLPPGLQKQLQRNGRLPPGLQKRVAPFPSDLERRLPSLPPGIYRGTVGDQAIIYDPRTQAILDAIAIVTRSGAR